MLRNGLGVTFRCKPMRRTPLALLLLALTALAPAASGTAHLYEAKGSYAAGSPFGAFVTDACLSPNGATENVDSNCRAMPPGLDGHLYRLTRTKDATNSAQLSICFYAGTREIACEDNANDGATHVVPARATRFSVSSLTGVQVSWELKVF